MPVLSLSFVPHLARAKSYYVYYDDELAFSSGENAGDGDVAYFFGNSAETTVLINNGTDFSAAALEIGVNDPASLVVSGAGTTLVETTGTSIAFGTSDFIIGMGTGTSGSSLEILDGAAVTGNSIMTVGSYGAGSVTISGSGASLNLQGYTLVLGEHASGIMTLSDSGMLIAGAISLGTYSGGSGTINIGAAAGDEAMAPGTLGGVRTISGGDGAGTIVFNHTSSNYYFTAAVVGDVELEFYSGTTKLVGDYSSYSGTATVYGGTLINLVDNGPSVLVLSGGVLAGVGTVGDVSVGSGGILSPGQSIGTLTVDGDLVFASGSTLEIEVDNAGNADEVIASGAVTIGSGARLSVLAENRTDDGSTYAEKSDYVILSGTALSGSFDEVTENFAYLDASVEYSGTEATLVLTRTIVSDEDTADQTDEDSDTQDDTDGQGDADGNEGDGEDGNSADQGGDDDNGTDGTELAFSDLADTDNQRVVADVIEGLGSENPLYQAIEYLPDGEPASALQQLTGEVYPSLRSIMVSSALVDRTSILTRLIDVMGDTGSAGGYVSMGFHGKGSEPVFEQANAQLWGRSYGSWSKTHASAGSSSVTRYSGGFYLGADAEWIDGIRAGIVGGYSRTEFSSSGNAASGSADSYHSGIYAGGEYGAWKIRAGASYTWHDLSTDRSVSFTGFSDRLTAGFASSTAQLFGEVGYMLDGAQASFEPFSGLALIREHTDGFTENGGAAALVSEDETKLLAVTTLGLRGDAGIGTFMGLTARLNGAVAWRHALGDVAPPSTIRFASGGASFEVDGSPIDEDTALIEAGVAFDKDDRMAVGMTYQGEVGSMQLEHSGRLNLRYKF